MKTNRQARKGRTVRMGCCVEELRDKEVINITDGARLGFVTDVEIDTRDGRLTAIIAGGELHGMFSRRRELRIEWSRIERIGEDTVLVRCEIPDATGICDDGERKKRFRFF